MLCQNLLFFAHKGMAVIEKRFNLYIVSQYVFCTGKIDFMQVLTSQNKPVVAARDAFLFFRVCPCHHGGHGQLHRGLLGLGQGVWVISAVYLAGFFLLNCLSPVQAGIWQVSAIIIKLIPLFHDTVVKPPFCRDVNRCFSNVAKKMFQPPCNLHKLPYFQLLATSIRNEHKTVKES